MDEVYLYARVAYFVWAFALFMGLIYWGLQDMILARRCGHLQVPPEHYLFAASSLAATVTLLGALGEIFLIEEMEGGARTFLPGVFLFITSYALREGARRVKMHRRSVEMGWCQT